VKRDGRHYPSKFERVLLFILTADYTKFEYFKIQARQFGLSFVSGWNLCENSLMDGFTAE
jgi:hypothetical protein